MPPTRTQAGPHVELPQIGEWSDSEQLVSLQEKQLPYALSRAAESPFYRNRFGTSSNPRSFTDLANLPITTKQELRDNYPLGMLAVDPSELATYHESSGTAGEPTPSFYTAEDWVDLAERFARKSLGILPTDTFFVRTPYALMLTGHLAHAAGRLAGATVIPGDNRSLATPHSRVTRVLRDLEVTLTWSVPTECLLWAAAAKAKGQDPRADFPALRGLFVGGEPLTPARRARISRLWGVPVEQEYGCTETGSLAGECPAGYLHLWADRLIFEVFDPRTGTFSREGRGQLVATTLYRKAMPLIRYNLEDTVEVSYAECDCGWQLPVIHVSGRTASGHLVGGKRVTQHALEELVFRLPDEHEVFFWRARAEPTALHIEVEAPGPQQAAAAAALDTAVRRELGVDCEVTASDPGTLVPERVLLGEDDVVKPRSLFGPGEDWSKAVLYY